jgi:Family of unknown function (DUF6188)
VSRIIHTVRVEHVDVRLDWILGRSIIDVSLAEPVPWRFRFSDSEGITVECLWRIISGGRLTRTSSDHGHQFGLPAPVDAAREATAALADRTVTEVHLRSGTGDLQLRFDADLVLEIIPDFSGYEAWQIYGPGGVCYGAHGGSFSTWRHET